MIKRAPRKENWIQIRRSLVRKHGRKLGPWGIAVYVAIVSLEDGHADILNIADVLGCSCEDVRQEVGKLADLGLIEYDEEG